VPRQSLYRIALILALVVLSGAVVFMGNRLHDLFNVLDAMGSCVEVNQSQTLSPDRHYIVTVLVRDCGSMKGYVTHVNLRKAKDVFLADRDGVITAGEVVTTRGVAFVTTRWVQNTELDVGLRGTGPLSINAVGSWNDVVIHAFDERVYSPSPR